MAILLYVQKNSPFLLSINLAGDYVANAESYLKSMLVRILFMFMPSGERRSIEWKIMRNAVTRQNCRRSY